MDKYTKAVRRLQKSKNFERDVYLAWSNYKSDENGCLFAYCRPPETVSNLSIGCLTMVKGSDNRTAYTPELTAAIKADKLLPARTEDITKENITRFAYWQRRMAKVWKQLELEL